MLRRLLKILGFLILAFIVVIAGFLGNAHWQVRQVQTPLPTIDDVRAMLSQVDGPKSIRVINTGTQNVPGKGVLAYPAFELQWPDNRILMIDVGMTPDGATRFGQLIESIAGADPVTPHGSVSDQLGEAMVNVAGVAFTHLHEDHTSGLHALCKGREIPLFQTSQQTDMENFSTAIGNIAIEEASCMHPTLLQGEGPLYPIPGFPGLLAFPAGGHTPGSTVYFVNVEDTLWILAGDITNAKISITNNVPKPTSYSLFVTPEATGRLEALRIWLAELDTDPAINVLVSHDLVALQDSHIPIVKGTNSK